MKAAGFSLIELMLAMALGLMLGAAALGLLQLGQRGVQRAGLETRLQQDAMTAFALLSEDLRAVGASPCPRGRPVSSLIADGPDRWWRDWQRPLQGVDGRSVGAAAGTDALRFTAVTGPAVELLGHDPMAQRLRLAHSLAAEPDPVVVVCDLEQSTLLQVRGAGSSLRYSAGGLNRCGRPGHAPSACGDGIYQYPANAMVAPLQVLQWSVRSNGRGGRSLYRAQMQAGGRLENAEMVEAVEGLRLRYLERGTTFRSAAAVTDWGAVRAVEVVLTFAADESMLALPESRRQLQFVVALHGQLE